MVLYPDNANRAQRVSDLANDIAFIQNAIKQSRDSMATSEADAYAMLQRLATAAGFPTVDAYLQKAYDLMTPDQKKKYDDMRAAYSKQSGDVDTALFVFGGVATLGILVGLGAKFVESWSKIQNILAGYRSMAQTITNAVDGVNDAGEAVEMTELVFEEAAQDADAAGEGAAEASAALAGARLASKVLGAVAIVASIGIIIYDGIEGAKQRDQLRGYIVECCGKRWIAYGIELRVDAAFTQMSKAEALLYERDILNGLVQDGTLTQAQADAKLQKQIESYVADFDAAMDLVTNDKINDGLTTMDKSSTTWTNEDPNETDILQWVKDNQPKDGSPIPS